MLSLAPATILNLKHWRKKDREEFSGKFDFCHPPKLFFEAVPSEEHGLVQVAFKARAFFSDWVRHDEVEIFPAEFCQSVFPQIPGFSRKADQDLAGFFSPAELKENVRRGDQLEGNRPPGFF